MSPEQRAKVSATKKARYAEACELVDPSGMTPLQARIDRLCTPEPNTGCWLWCGYVAANGYGYIRIEARRPDRPRRSECAHRVSYRAWRGDIPIGLDLDHLCCQTVCVNPAHLEPVTRGENNRRARAREMYASFAVRSSAVNERDLLSIAEAARYVGVSTRTIFSWLQEGRLECVRTASGRARIYAGTLPVSMTRVFDSSTAEGHGAAL